MKTQLLTLYKNNTQNGSFKKKDIFKIKYQEKPINSTKLYSKETRYISLEEGVIEDDSKLNNYANNCSCSWIITVPIGKRIKFTFDELNTQSNAYFIYLVDGKTAIPKNIFAKLNGQNIPPVFYSRTNEVLVWFLSDNTATAKGWRFKYEAVD